MQAVVDEGNLVTRPSPHGRLAGQTTEGVGRRTYAHVAALEYAAALSLVEDAAIEDRAALLLDLGQPPVDASAHLGDAGTPVVIPGVDGTGCCGVHR